MPETTTPTPPHPDDRCVEILESIRSEFRVLSQSLFSMLAKFDEVPAVVTTDVAVLTTDMHGVKDHLGLNGGTPPPAKRMSRRTRKK